ncbi:ketol-acid reductoisomerase [Buchnera aphidicola (Kurisakia onigurumii)]|uniref:ketol-acid reductoisomerase n=1 Tax=Buchnera aphidicola TaxID=9 RepID=UPI0031B6C7C1
MNNYFNKLNFRQKLIQLRKCRFMKKREFKESKNFLINKNIVIIGCGSQGLNQGLNMRDSGLNVTFALRRSSIAKKNLSWNNAIKNNFLIGTYKEVIPTADLVINLTPDKQHPKVIQEIIPFMKKKSVLGYSHGFNIIEMGQKIRSDITVIMVAPKCPGTEVREEYKKGFGVPTLIAVHEKNDPYSIGLSVAKSWAHSIGSDKAGVLESSFSAEVKSDLMGEQTILCGMLQSASLLYYKKLIQNGRNAKYSVNIIQKGWEILTESLKKGGITLMMDRFHNASKIKICSLSLQLKKILRPLFEYHMDEILSGEFSKKMIQDWNNNDQKLIFWRKKTKNSLFEKAIYSKIDINEEEYFKNGIVMAAILKSGIELAFEIMTESGILEESAYYESLHELPLIANTIARKRLYEMNIVISDTAEYGNYIFTEKAIPLLKPFFQNLNLDELQKLSDCDYSNIDNSTLKNINENIRNHPIEIVGKKLRFYMKKTKK